MRKEREERKQRYLLNICTYAHKYIHNKIGGILMTVIVLVSVAGPKVVACNYSYFLLLPILYSSCPQQARQQCVVLYLVMPVVQFPSLLWSKTVPQKESSHLQMMARLCQNPKERPVLQFNYRGLAKAPNNIPICHWHFKYHWICWIKGHKWQNSLDLLQTIVFFCAPLKTSIFSGYSVNGPEQHTQIRNILPPKSKELQ